MSHVKRIVWEMHQERARLECFSSRDGVCTGALDNNVLNVVYKQT